MLFVLYPIFALTGAIQPLVMPFFFDLQNLVCLLALVCLFISKYWARVLVSLLVGAFISACHVDQRVSAQLPESLENQPLVVTGTVVSKSRSQNGFTRFDFYVDHHQIAEDSIGANSAFDHWQGGKALLSVRDNGIFPFHIERGQEITLPVKLRRPRGLVNPGGFDYHAWLLSKNYVARGYVFMSNGNQIVLNSHQKNKKQSVHSLVNEIDEYLGGTLFEKQLYTSGYLKQEAILRALLLGDKSLISPEQWDTFLHTGTIHLMAISGLHVGLLAGFSFFLIRRILSPFSDWLGIVALRVIPAVFSLIVSGSYAFISGLGVPSQRAWLALLVFYAIHLFGRTTNPYRIVLILALVVVFVNPFVLTQNGFLLSFGAVIVLLVAFSFRVRQDKSGVKTVFDFLKAQWVMLVGLLFLLMFCSLPVSPVGFFANVIAVPLISLLVLPCLFVSAAISVLSESVARAFLYMADFSLDMIMLVLEGISQVSSSIYLSLNSWWLAGSIGLFIFCSLIPRQFSLHAFAFVCFFTIVLSEKTNKVDQISVLDVGQGLSIVVNSQGNTLVYDAGAKFSESIDIGADVVAPFLRHRNVNQIDTMVLSHSDFDHAGGLEGLAQALPISRLYANDVPSLENTNTIDTCAVGKDFSHGNFNVSVLWPYSVSLEANRDHVKSNNRSCVLLFERGEFKALFAGDIESEVEYELLRKDLLPRDVDLLVASHHGSNTSSTAAFIKRLKPNHVVFSAGYKNRYRHPSPKVTARFEAFSESELWNTANDGAIQFTFEDANPTLSGAYRVESARQESGKPWERVLP